MFRFLTLFLITFLSLLPLQAQENSTPTPKVKAELLADVSAIAPGKPFTVGVYFQIIPKWHIYWMNPGDSGYATAVEWELPEGWKVSGPQWPIPEKHVEPGDMIVFGYEKETLLFFTITPPETLTPSDSPVTIEAKANWLVCEQACVPEDASLSLTLPVATEENPPTRTHAETFEKFRAQLPKTAPPPFTVRWEPLDTETYLKVEGVPEGATLDFFPITPLLKHPTQVSPGVFRVPYPEPPEPPHVRGLLVMKHGDKTEAWVIDSANAKKGTTPAAALPSDVKEAPPMAPVSTESPISFGKALGFGFIGGFILNLMPCVLPVIALKIFGFLGQVGESRQRVFKLGAAFVAGIFAWFWALAALILIARSFGKEITWAFQFQNPNFVLGMAILVFVFALNLLGVFELTLPGMGKLNEVSGREGYGGAFLHGMFATLLATPCTAPFLGPALAFAFAQQAPITFAMFTSIAAGMGFPYLILTAKPGWMRFLPRPGDWMVRLKQVMGFLLLGTVIWLLGVFATTSGLDATLNVIWLLLSIGMACWIFGVWFTPTASRMQHVIALAAMIFIIAATVSFVRQTEISEPEGGASGSSNPVDHWEPWSQEKVNALVAEGKPVFIDFTADWCLNCKFNEKRVLAAPAVQEALKGVTTLKGDWTKGDPAITAALKSYGRIGVPVYVFYPANGGAPEVLPEILTQSLVIDTVTKSKP